MKKKVELELIEPVYQTYHNGMFSAVIKNNPSIRNFYLNEVMMLMCSRKFLSGFTTPEINIDKCSLWEAKHLERKVFSFDYLEGCANRLICNLIDNGYYVVFSGVDDYYIEGKSLYKKRHFEHDGAICGYDWENKTFCMYAYDSNWIYRKFWTSQRGFTLARKSMEKRGIPGAIWAIKAKEDIIEFSSEVACRKIGEYLDSSLEKYPENEEGMVYGIVVHDYIAKYVEKLFKGEIPYERLDRRVFRLIWEHKKIMLERIKKIEEELGLEPNISKEYCSIVDEANMMRGLYASHHVRRRDSVLPVIQKKLLEVKNKEELLLKELLKNSDKKLQK